MTYTGGNFDGTGKPHPIRTGHPDGEDEAALDPARNRTEEAADDLERAAEHLKEAAEHLREAADSDAE